MQNITQFCTGFLLLKTRIQHHNVHLWAAGTDKLNVETSSSQNSTNVLTFYTANLLLAMRSARKRVPGSEDHLRQLGAATSLPRVRASRKDTPEENWWAFNSLEEVTEWFHFQKSQRFHQRETNVNEDKTKTD